MADLVKRLVALRKFGRAIGQNGQRLALHQHQVRRGPEAGVGAVVDDALGVAQVHVFAVGELAEIAAQFGAGHRIDRRVGQAAIGVGELDDAQGAAAARQLIGVVQPLASIERVDKFQGAAAFAHHEHHVLVRALGRCGGCRRSGLCATGGWCGSGSGHLQAGIAAGHRQQGLVAKATGTYGAQATHHHHAFGLNAEVAVGRVGVVNGPDLTRFEAFFHISAITETDLHAAVVGAVLHRHHDVARLRARRDADRAVLRPGAAAPCRQGRHHTHQPISGPTHSMLQKCPRQTILTFLQINKSKTR